MSADRKERTDAEDRVITANGLDMALASHHTGVHAASHLASLRGQMQAALVYVRRAAMFYHDQAGPDDLFKCPYCGQLWPREGGCSTVRCGNAESMSHLSSSTLATFVFGITDSGGIAHEREACRALFQGLAILWSRPGMWPHTRCERYAASARLAASIETPTIDTGVQHLVAFYGAMRDANSAMGSL